MNIERGVMGQKCSFAFSSLSTVQIKLIDTTLWIQQCCTGGNEDGLFWQGSLSNKIMKRVIIAGQCRTRPSSLQITQKLLFTFWVSAEEWAEMDRARSRPLYCSTATLQCWVVISGLFGSKSPGSQGWDSIQAWTLCSWFVTIDITLSMPNSVVGIEDTMQNQSCKDSVNVAHWVGEERVSIHKSHTQFQIRTKRQSTRLKLSTLSFKDLLFQTWYFFLTYRIRSKCLFMAFKIRHSLVPIIFPKLYFCFPHSAFSYAWVWHGVGENSSEVWVPRFTSVSLQSLAVCTTLGKLLNLSRSQHGLLQ